MRLDLQIISYCILDQKKDEKWYSVHNNPRDRFEVKFEVISLKVQLNNLWKMLIKTSSETALAKNKKNYMYCILVDSVKSQFFLIMG